MDKYGLIDKIKHLDGLTDDEKAALLGLLRSHKKYGLVWEDKPEAVEDELKEKLPVLTEVKDRAIINDTESEHYPNHILIEGENLHALTVLSYTHSNSIDVIYIDPPYNTGNRDFIYNDQFVDNEDSYRHSKWLSFMSKRLKIAKKLISKRGVIFISIDDNEQAQLKLLCDEIFGANKFVATIPWRKRTAKTDVPHSFSQDYEWVVMYANEKFQAGIEKESRKYYETPDLPGRPWRVHDLTKQTTAEERPNSYFAIINPKNGEKYPANRNRTWAITEETFEKYYAENRMVFPGDYSFLKIKRPVLRYWKADDMKKAGDKFGFTTVSSYLPSTVGMTQEGTKDVTDIFGIKAFGFPKPLSLIKYLIQVSTPRAKNITILDFFAGSGTTLDATMKLNAEDGGHRQCILVTNNENGICENVTYVRNKKVIEGYTTPKGEHIAGLTHNNLRYYKTDFVPRDRTVKNMRDLVNAATDMLCIKENMYREQTLFGPWDELPKLIARHFVDGEGGEMIIIYDENHIGEIAKAIRTMKFEKPLKVYVFSTDRDPYEDEFDDVLDKVDLCALPAAIYDAYVQVMPRPQDKNVDMAVDSNEEGLDDWDDDVEMNLAAEEGNK